MQSLLQPHKVLVLNKSLDKHDGGYLLLQTPIGGYANSDRSINTSHVSRTLQRRS